LARLGDELRAQAAAPLTELVRSKARSVLVAAFRCGAADRGSSGL
jgi:hypothetical protein